MPIQGNRFAFFACALLSHYSLIVSGIPTVSIKGSKFFTDDGEQFYIKGVAYQSSQVDTNNLTNGPLCKIDAEALKELGANVVRVYSVDPTLNHDECMKAFEDAGIYVLIDMTTPTIYINSLEPEWTKSLRDAFAQVVDGFQQYNNTLGFFAGNEIINQVNNTNAAMYVKAAIADMKAYRDLMRYRNIPIGYSGADVAIIRETTQNYFACGNSSQSADFFATNRYSWCGDSSMLESGYDQLYDDLETYPIPLFFSENGCKGQDDTSEPNRKFSDQPSIYGRDMNDRISGNIIYEWSEEMGDFTRLSKQWATLTPAGVEKTAYNPSMTKPSCPGFASGSWSLKANAALPTIGMSGFTAPSGTTSGARPVQTPGATRPAGENNNSTNPDPKTSNIPGGGDGGRTPVGAIVGGVVGGLVLIAGLIIGCLLLRRKRKRFAAGAGIGVGGEGAQTVENDKMVMDAGEEVQKHGPEYGGYYDPAHQELHGQHAVPELDPSKGHVAPMRANEMSSGYELPGELPHGQQDQVRYSDREPIPSPTLGHNSLAQPANEPSPYVQAQRRTEIDWLESEEARLRQRRELLAKQSGGGGEN